MYIGSSVFKIIAKKNIGKQFRKDITKIDKYTNICRFMFVQNLLAKRCEKMFLDSFHLESKWEIQDVKLL